MTALFFSCSEDKTIKEKNYYVSFKYTKGITVKKISFNKGNSIAGGVPYFIKTIEEKPVTRIVAADAEFKTKLPSGFAALTIPENPDQIMKKTYNNASLSLKLDGLKYTGKSTINVEKNDHYVMNGTFSAKLNSGNKKITVTDGRFRVRFCNK